ncbi:transposase [Methylobacterium sp. DB0501]|uniref:transposase n=1 Tax=Methylobacterium sp. DB0501 TaxID=2709665 RepID=UPI0028AD1F16|nr:transposase [Methylobacterium sp. DB0501]
MTVKALAAVIREAFIQGISTRAVDDPVQASGGTGISKSQLGRRCPDIDERVNAFARTMTRLPASTGGAWPISSGPRCPSWQP